MLNSILLIVIMLTGLLVIAKFILGRIQWRAKVCNLESTLMQSIETAHVTKVDFENFSLLPKPVVRYFKYALTDGQQIITTIKIHQLGVLRTSTTKNNWFPFKASQLVVPSALGFMWNAQVAMPFKTQVGVLDTYIAGVGSGSVSIFSALVIASETDGEELNAGALHRYLAEPVWYPTALLPESGVVWTAINDQTALATLKDGVTSVSLEFRFNSTGEVTGIYSPGRFRKIGNEYIKTPWEGRFLNYTIQGGMSVPTYGEVGWYESGVRQVVWKGNINDVQFGF